MTNLKNAEIWVTVEYSRTLTGIKCDNWKIYQRRDGKLHHVTLLITSVIPGLHANLFSVTWVLQKVFQVTSEFESLIFKKNPTEIRFDKKMANNSGEDFYWPLTSTRAQKTPPVCVSTRKICKGRQTYIRKGWLSRNKIIQQPNDSRRGNVTPARSMQR